MRVALICAVVGLTVWAQAWSTPAAESSSALNLRRFTIDGQNIAQRFPAGTSVSFRYPSSWYVTTRRLDDVLDPRTLFALSNYRIPNGRDDCDGTHARGRPSDGAFVLVKETLDKASLRRSLPRLPARPPTLRLPTTGRAGCLAPASVAYQFRVAHRAFYVWISIGPRASTQTRGAVRAMLNTMWFARYSSL